MTVRLAGRIGATPAERTAWLKAHPAAAPSITCIEGTGRCPCGGYTRFLHRRRWVCVRCARWLHASNQDVLRWSIRWATDDEFPHRSVPLTDWRTTRPAGPFHGNALERAAWKQTHALADPVITCVGGSGQCRCGGYTRFLYRRRWVCVRCAGWVHVANPAVLRWKVRWATADEREAQSWR